jgi:CRISPR-associated protein (TIGR03986 family)
MIKSPYNFVPAPSENEVFVPEWADQVSHDIPFSDGESGEIEFTITAETPIFIRNGMSKPADGERPTDEFSHYLDKDGNKKYFIPATSIKGMLRNVLEIMSFSRMNQVDGSPFYGLRDMNNSEYKSETNQKNLKSGWLVKNGNKWQINEVEHKRISMQEIEKKFYLGLNSIQKADSAIAKYNALGQNGLIHKFIFVKELKKAFGAGPEFKYGDLYKFDANGDFEGTIVFYGTIDNKHYDFVFGNDTLEQFQVSDTLISNMEQLDIPLWKFHKNKDRIPVFFKSEDNKVKHFGFSKLYRLNNGNSVGNLYHNYKYNEKNINDFAETIFGKSDNNESLKGRLFFSNAKCIFKPEEILNTETRVLSSPKSSYYPAYIKQADENGKTIKYNTYIDSNSKLSGFKRYPVHNSIKPNGDSDNENIPSSFEPLPKDTKFSCKVRFHNLKKEELGALLSSITFHDSKEKLYHTIGGAKPYGYGKVELKIVNIIPQHHDSIGDFQKIMNGHCKKLGKEWLKSKNLIELFSMAKNPVNNVDSFLTYPILELKGVKAKDANEFNNIKKDKKYLEDYSKTYGFPEIREFESIYQIELQKEKIRQYEIEKHELKMQEEAKKLEEQGLFHEALTSKDVTFVKSYIEKNPFREGIDEVRRHLKEITPVGLPERLVNGNLNSEQFLKEATAWKNKNLQIFANFEEQLKERFLVIAKGQKIENLKIKIEALFTNPQSLYDELTKP